MAQILESSNEVAERSEMTMTPAERNRLINEYSQCLEDARKAGNMDMVDYYNEKMEPLKEAQKQERQEYWKEYWENKRQEIMEESRERQQKMAMDNIKRRTPNYGTPTTESGWADKAANEFRQNGESWYYNVCMNEAAKCHVEEALNKK